VAVADQGCDHRPVTTSIALARADLDEGRAWKARDRLDGLLTTRQDDEVLDLMGEVRFAMGDLPAAGALWFVTGRDDETAAQLTLRGASATAATRPGG
jgi:hypothetical protein